MNPRSGDEPSGRRTGIIFVHGTGTATRDAKLPRWWQPTSAFARQLVGLIGQPVCVAKPQRWSGLNLESSRRAAGAALLARLRRLDERGVDYHLIGHSHGGSVIWHALVGSARAGRPLSGLRGWVTIGTPFLRFTPDPTAWWRYIALFIVALALVWTYGPAVEAWKERSSIVKAVAEAGLWSEIYAIFTIALFAALALNAVVLFFHVARHFVDLLLRTKLTAAERRAAEWYGGNWLALWHPRDEAIAGLRASLVSPLQLWPRLAAATASRIKRFTLAVYDQGFARAVDQFVWGVGMGRLQGADISDQRMAQARHCPDALSPGWASLPPSVCDAMTATADAKAAATTASFREHLATAGELQSADQVFSSFGASISWQELIHTSYFDQVATADVIADHISGGNEDDGRPLAAWRRERAPGPETPSTRRARLLAFPINRAIASLTATFLLATAALSSYEAAISPYTQRFLVNQIAAEVKSPGLASVRADALGDILIRLVALGRVADFHEYLDLIVDNESKIYAFDRLANAYGRDLPATTKFLTPQFIAKLDKYFSTYPPALRVSAEKIASENPMQALFIASVYPYYPGKIEILSGLVDARRKVPPALIVDIVENVKTQRPKVAPTDIAFKEGLEKASSPESGSGEIRRKVEDQILKEQYSEAIATFVVNLYAIGEKESADRLLDEAFNIGDRKLRYCPESPSYIRRAGTLGSLEAVTKVGGLCRSRSLSTDYLLEAAFAAHAARRLDVAGTLFDTVKAPLQSLKFSPQLWSALLLQIDRGKADDALTLISQWLERVRRSVDHATQGRVVKLMTRLRLLAQRQPADRERIEAAVKTVMDTATGALEKAIADPFNTSRTSKGELVRELASIYVALDRKSDARRLADQAAANADLKTVSDKIEVLDIAKSRREEEHVKRARDSVRAGTLYSLLGERDLAARRFREALPLVDGKWVDDTYEVGCAVYAATFASDPDVARRALEIATGRAVRVQDLPTRSIMIGNLAYRAAMVGDLHKALSLARSAANPLLTAGLYSLIVDRVVLKDDPDVYKRWGFDGTSWRPIPAAFLKVDSVPPCGSD